MGRPLSRVSNSILRMVCSPGHSRLVLGLLQAVEELQAHGGRRLGRLCIGARLGSLLCTRIRRQHCSLRLSGPLGPL